MCSLPHTLAAPPYSAYTGAAAMCPTDASDPRKVIVVSMSLVVAGREDIVLDLQGGFAIVSPPHTPSVHDFLYHIRILCTGPVNVGSARVAARRMLSFCTLEAGGSRGFSGLD